MSRQQQYQIVAAHLRKQIENGSLPPGAAIPSEAELCQQFDCARGTIRQAITALRNEGLVSSGQGRRTRVLDTVPTQYFDAVLSFTQWCHASGIEPGQQTQYVMRRLADAELAALLEIPEGTPIEASDERYIGTVANFTTTATRGNPAPSTLLPNPPTTVHSV